MWVGILFLDVAAIIWAVRMMRTRRERRRARRPLMRSLADAYAARMRYKAARCRESAAFANGAYRERRWSFDENGMGR